MLSVLLASSAMNTLKSAFVDADFFGKIIFLSLFFTSLICWAVLLYNLWLVNYVKKTSVFFSDAILKQKQSLLTINSESLPSIRFKELPHPFAQIFLTLRQKSLEILDKNHFFLSQSQEMNKDVYLSSKDIDLVDAQIHMTIHGQKEYLERNLFILSTITTIAPFLGLLGTVWGILVTFGELGTGGNLGSSNTILSGLSTALATTVIGLLIAIPALVSYNYLKNSCKVYYLKMLDFGHLLLSTLELQYRKVDKD